MPSDAPTTGWLSDLLGVGIMAEGQRVEIAGRDFVLRDGILRSESVLASAEQQQTSQVFGFKWHRTKSFESDAFRAGYRGWLVEKYGDIESYLPPGRFLLLDAGCGAAVAALELFGMTMRRTRTRYLGIDTSIAVDVAKRRCREAGADADFLQCDLNELPLKAGSVDVIFAEGVLHHTDSTERALENLVPLLRPGGMFLFYVYRKKGPIREFTDDYLRAKLAGMPLDEAWNALRPLTELGKLLGDLDVEVDVPEAIPLLEIPAGRINLQRLFYWHVCKAFYSSDLSLEEMNHVNFDWYAPSNARRHTPEEVRQWCAVAGLETIREVVEEAGITVVARKV